MNKLYLLLWSVFGCCLVRLMVFFVCFLRGRSQVVVHVTQYPYKGQLKKPGRLAALGTKVPQAKNTVPVVVIEEPMVSRFSALLSQYSLLLCWTVQESLPASISARLSQELNTQHQVTLLLAVLEDCVAFLVSIGTSEAVHGETLLSEYALETLLLEEETWKAATCDTVDQVTTITDIRYPHLKYV